MGGLGPGILVTRSQPGVNETAARLEGLGYRAYSSPLLHIDMHPAAKPDMAGVQALMATSAHGVAALAGVQGARALPLYCLAGASATRARSDGWGQNLHTIAGDGAALARFVGSTADPARGPLVWARGAHVAFDAGAALEQAGFAMRPWQAYTARPAAALMPEVLAAWQGGRLALALVYSARGAQTLRALAKSQELPCRGLAILAISARAAAPLKSAGFAAIHLAPLPDEDAMLAALAQVLPPK